MSDKINFKKTFNDLVTAYANWDEITQEKLIEKFKNSEKVFQVEVEDESPRKF